MNGGVTRTSRLIGLVAAVALVACTGVLSGTTPASAVETPIYNAPEGGGPVQEVIEKFGPFTLDPLGGLHSQDIGEGLVPRPPGGFGLKYAFFDLVDENGQPVGRHEVHLHHFVIGAVGKIDTACPDRMELGVHVQPLIGSGMERTPLAFPDPYALQVGPNDMWGAMWHLMNMTNTTKTFYVQYILGVQPGATAENTRFVTPFWTDTRHCPAGETWDVPGNGGPGAVEVNTATWPMPFDGYIVGVGGHMHDGGISITTKHEDGTFICENLASYYQGMLDKISACPVHDTVKKGELLSVSSKYDNSAPHDQVMGMGVMFLWQGDQGTPPTTTTTTTTTAPAANTNDPSAAVQASTATPATPATPVSATPSLAG